MGRRTGNGTRALPTLALPAATDYALAAEESPFDETDLLDEHGLDGQRAANYACYVHGAHPDPRKDLVGDGRRVTEDRAEGCPDEWQQARDGWRQLLAGHLRQFL
ncbi:DUF4344 domain-containing metallopeptidase [Streptomyces noursei]|uniref:DUF4344 domain-containing metallopeptidase n=1 Tax=Streptomyces noursei TaxID=1971 RepID=UPI00167BC92F|nr:DUF4344 domain-containing metallopeptidase [Streptomyces noursei]MCZ1020503.1 DUF4344 domain-containing metallopeptidase [Streptomyces noursei]GGX13284.1 hypothetical protein GCM10010341_38530 [Streptomyces noursei]